MSSQQGLFSATQTDEVESLMRAGLRNPVRVTVREKYKIAKVRISVYFEFGLSYLFDVYFLWCLFM